MIVNHKVDDVITSNDWEGNVRLLTPLRKLSAWKVRYLHSLGYSYVKRDDAWMLQDTGPASRARAKKSLKLYAEGRIEAGNTIEPNTEQVSLRYPERFRSAITDLQERLAEERGYPCKPQEAIREALRVGLGLEPFVVETQS